MTAEEEAGLVESEDAAALAKIQSIERPHKIQTTFNYHTSNPASVALHPNYEWGISVEHRAGTRGIDSLIFIFGVQNMDLRKSVWYVTPQYIHAYDITCYEQNQT